MRYGLRGVRCGSRDVPDRVSDGPPSPFRERRVDRDDGRAGRARGAQHRRRRRSAHLAVVAGLLALSLFAAAYGRLGERGAVLLTVDDDTVYFGDEDRTLVSYPLTALRSFAIGGPADDTSPMAGQRAQHLTVFGQKYLKLTFAREQPRVGAGVDEDLDSDFWRVAIIEGDPAAAVVIDRLKQYAPQRVSTQKRSTQKSSTRPRAAAEQREKVSVASVPPGHDASSDEHSPVDLRRPPVSPTPDRMRPRSGCGRRRPGATTRSSASTAATNSTRPSC